MADIWDAVAALIAEAGDYWDVVDRAIALVAGTCALVGTLYAWARGTLPRLLPVGARSLRLLLYPLRYEGADVEAVERELVRRIRSLRVDLAILHETTDRTPLARVNQGLSARFRPWARERACSGRQTTHRQALLYKASKLRLTRDPAGDAFERDAAALVFEPAGGGPALQMFPRPPLIRRVEVRSWFGAHELLLVAVHLRAPRPGSRLATAIDESRRMALEALADWLGTVHRRDPLLPIVLAGTFWEQRGADAIQMLKRRSGLVDLSERAAPDAFTFRAAGDSFRAYVDFILVTPELLDDRAPRDPVLAIDEIEAEFGERVTDRRPQFVALRVETRARIRRARERALDR